MHFHQRLEWFKKSQFNKNEVSENLLPLILLKQIDWKSNYETYNRVVNSQVHSNILSHIARLSWKAFNSLISQDLLQIDKTSLNNGIFIPPPPLRYIERTELMNMHYRRLKTGSVDELGKVFSIAKKFRQIFTMAVLQELQNENLLKIELDKNQGRSWSGVYLTIKGWIIALLIEAKNGLSDFCKNEIPLRLTGLEKLGMNDGVWIHFPSRNKFVHEFCNSAIQNSGDLILLHDPFDGGSWLSKEICRNLMEEMIPVYIDLLKWSKSGEINEYVFETAIEAFETEFDHSRIELFIQLNELITKYKKKKFEWDQFEKFIHEVNTLLKVKKPLVLIYDHVLHVLTGYQGQRFRKFISYPSKFKRVAIINNRHGLSDIWPNATVKFLPNISMEEIMKYTEAILAKSILHPANLMQIEQEIEKAMGLKENLMDELIVNEIQEGRKKTLGEILLILANLLETRLVETNVPNIISKHLEPLLLQTDNLEAIDWLIRQILEPLEFPEVLMTWSRWIEIEDFRSMQRLLKEMQLHPILKTLLESSDGKVRFQHDIFLRSVFQISKQFQLNEDEIIAINQLNKVKIIVQQWQGSLTYDPITIDLQKVQKVIEDLLPKLNRKGISLNLENVGTFLAVEILQNVYPAERLLLMAIDYLPNSLMEILSLLQVMQLPIQEKRALLEQFSVNLLQMTKELKPLQEIAGSIVECYLHTPSQYLRDLLECAIEQGWKFPSFEKLQVLAEFISTSLFEFREFVLKEEIPPLELVQGMLDNPRSGDELLTLVFVKLIRKNWNPKAFVKFISQFLLGKLKIEEQAENALVALTAENASLLQPLVSWKLHQRATSGYIGTKQLSIIPFYVCEVLENVEEQLDVLLTSIPKRKISTFEEFIRHMLELSVDSNKEKQYLQLFENLASAHPEIVDMDKLQVKPLSFPILELALQYQFSFSELLEPKDNELYWKFVDPLVKPFVEQREDGRNALKAENLLRRIYRSLFNENKSISFQVNCLLDFIGNIQPLMTNKARIERCTNFMKTTFFPASSLELIDFIEELVERIFDPYGETQITMSSNIILASTVMEMAMQYQETTDELVDLLDSSRSQKPVLHMITVYRNRLLHNQLLEKQFELPLSLLRGWHDFAFVGHIASGAKVFLLSDLEKKTLLSSHLELISTHIQEIIRENHDLNPEIFYLVGKLFTIETERILFHFGFLKWKLLDRLLEETIEETTDWFKILDRILAPPHSTYGLTLNVHLLLFERYLHSIKTKDETLSIKCLYLINHAVAIWPIEQPSTIIQSIREAYMLDKWSSRIAKMQAVSLVNTLNRCQELIESLGSKQLQSFHNFLKQQGVWVRELADYIFGAKIFGKEN